MQGKRSSLDRETVLTVIHAVGSKRKAAEALGVSYSVVDRIVGRDPKPAGPVNEGPPVGQPCGPRPVVLGGGDGLITPRAAINDFGDVSYPPGSEEKLLKRLRREPMTVNEIRAALGASAGITGDGIVAQWLSGQVARGVNLLELADHRFAIEKAPPANSGPVVELFSDDNNTFSMGAMGDSHLCSKYQRLDVLNALYDRYADEGLSHVFHAGNWIDGEAPFNRYDLLVHGMDAQIRYLAEHYPARPGITTYAVAGDDHEGWYGQRNGVNIGWYAERAMQDAGREDWKDLGYMEAFVKLTNRKSGQSSMLAVVHPGGGSAYATSYTVQKIVESYAGGEKPAILLCGHYHKLEFINIRNVWTLQTGCQQDQTPFMRKKRLEAHVGGHVLRAKQDPRTGAIVEATVTTLRYFNSGYYNDRWSHSGPVNLPARTQGGV